MLDVIRERPFLVAILAGACAQFIKVIGFVAVERRVNYRRLVQTDGAPNMHTTAFAALSVASGIKDGFDSLGFTLAVCLTAIIVVDTMNVKNATSRQAEAILLLMDRVLHRQAPSPRKRLSYTPMDVFSGLVLGIAVALLIL